MLKLIKKTIIVVFVIVIISGLSGCGKDVGEGDNNGKVFGDSTEFDTAAIIVGNHMNAPTTNLDSISSILGNVCINAGNITIIENDGNPFVDHTFDVPEPKAGISKSKLKSNAEKQANEICQYVKKLKPKTSEVDTLGSIILASKMLSNSNGERVLIIHDPGISTVGMLDMSSSILTMETDVIVQKLKENECIPNLENVKVLWVGIGEPVGEQEKPSEKDYNKIKKIYERILLEGGVKKEDLKFITLGEYDYTDTDWPDVKTIEFAESSILSEDDVAFKNNSIEFIDNNKAYNKIKTIAESYDCEQTLLVVGFASSEGNPNHNLQLSQRRAEKVSGILEEYGLDTIAVGLGYDEKYCIYDRSTSGEIEEDKAQRNRKILVMLANSNVAKEIMR